MYFWWWEGVGFKVNLGGGWGKRGIGNRWESGRLLGVGELKELREGNLGMKEELDLLEKSGK